MPILIPYNQLSQEQSFIINHVLRTSKNVFIEGPPGSGKTLISLYILRGIVSEQNVRPLFLLYDRGLLGYLIPSLSELKISENVTITTKDKLFWDIAKKYEIAPNFDLSYESKYSFILSNLLNVEIEKKFQIIVVDEVQDFSAKEWELVKRISQRVISIGDFNQAIHNTKLHRETVIKGGEYLQLTDIYRVQNNFIKLSNLFSNSIDVLEKKVRVNSTKQPYIIDTSFEDEFSKIAEIIKEPQVRCNRFVLICPDEKRLIQLSSYLNIQNIVHTYSRHKIGLGLHDFNSTEPILISSLNAKGLEFGSVILFGFGKFSFMVKRMQLENRLNSVLYVAITRAKHDLYIIRNENTIDELKSLKVDSISDLRIDE